MNFNLQRVISERTIEKIELWDPTDLICSESCWNSQITSIAKLGQFRESIQFWESIVFVMTP